MDLHLAMQCLKRCEIDFSARGMVYSTQRNVIKFV
jgi:hypothetical protein